MGIILILNCTCAQKKKLQFIEDGAQPHMYFGTLHELTVTTHLVKKLLKLAKLLNGHAEV